MTTNSKEVQSRADAKRAGKRARCWQCIVYEESAKDNWLNILREYMLETLVSPLHDMDMTDDGSQKKPHHHVLISFKNPHNYKDALEVFDSIGGVYPDPEKNWKLFTKQCRVRDFQIAARYHCHLDDADKHLYSMDDEIVFGAVDYISLCLTKADVDEMLGEIFDFMDTYAVRSYPQMVRYTKTLHPEWTRLVYSKCVRQIVDYAKGINFEIEKGVGTYLPEEEKENATDPDDSHSGSDFPKCVMCGKPVKEWMLHRLRDNDGEFVVVCEDCESGFMKLREEKDSVTDLDENF